MEITIQKSFRLNASHRGSVRRKISFNQVRQKFEKITIEPKIIREQTNHISIDNKKLEKCVIKKSVIKNSVPADSLKQSTPHKPKVPVKLIKRINDAIQEEIANDSNQKSKIKSKINFFEESSKSKYATNETPKIKLFNSSEKNYYGNQDMKSPLNDLNCKDSEAIEKQNSTIKSDSLDSGYCLREKPNSLPDSERKSIISLTSLSSLSTSYESESDVVLRKKDKPIPRERTTLNRTNTKLFRISKDKECNKLNINSPKLLQTENEIIVKRSSSQLSQDSGIDVNNSFIWSNITSTSSQREHETHDKSEEDLNEEHIYEELCNYRSHRNSMCDNDDEWIDIGNEPKKVQIEIVIKKPHTVRTHAGIYRKSYKPKSNQRKSRISLSTIKTVISDNSGNSETEYEDIDDDESVYSDSIYSDNNSLSENIQIQTVDQHLSHIYEVLTDVKDDNQTNIQQKNEVISNSLQTAFVKELSDKLIKKQNSWAHLNVQKRVVRNSISNLESERENPYSSTPHRVPKFQSANKTPNDAIRKRDSRISTMSSIYVNPNDFPNNNINRSPKDLTDNDRILIPFTKVRAEVFQKQNSVTGSLGPTYWEFNGPQEESSPFTSEPLYQFYQKDVRRRAELWIHADPNASELDYDVYESNSIYNRDSSHSVCDQTDSANNFKRSSKSSDILKASSALDFVGNGPNRSLWCHLPQVINSKPNLLQTLSEEQKRSQEAMFEIITSEASYCKSLNILVTHFNNCIELSENNPQVIIQREKQTLFSNITDIYKVSSKLLTDLEKRFQHNILLYDVCDILYDYAMREFTPYIRYCAYQRDQEKLLLKLKQSRSAFVDILQRLESNQICQNQNLLSFIMLPMQRITRYPLLIDAVCQQLPESSPIFESSRKALAALNHLVRKCNEETKKVQRMQELIEIEKILRFRSNVKSYPIVSGARYLVKRGPVVSISSQASRKRTIGKSANKWAKRSIELFLFSDLLILAKKKSENNYSVFDYCSRNTVQLNSLNNFGSIGSNLQISIPLNHTHLAQLSLLHNHEGKSVEHLISFGLESEKLRWIEAVSQPVSDNPNEVIYSEWDCPQVQCTRSYSAKQTDELNLEETDVVKVSRKMKDGWFEGERIRDGTKGWFPSDYTEEIVDQHVRARNIRLRHRLLVFTESFIEEQKRMSISSLKTYI